MSMDEHDGDRWWDQVDLTKLNLSSNSLTNISPDVQNLSALTFLDLHDNKLKSLPDTLGELRHLIKLNLSHNCLENLPPSLFELKELRSLLLQHNQLSDLCDDISNLSLLEDLDLSHNKLTTIPHAIGFLCRITAFNLSNNCLTSLPLEIGDIAALHRLELTHNYLLELPESIGQLSRLEQLYAQHNKLSSFPLMWRCPNLKEIHAGYNNIEEINEELLETLVNVRILDLRDNKISSIPDTITWLQSLERLDITNNNLSSLPYTLGTLPHLKSLCIDGNPMRSIRRDIIQRGTVQLLRWLRSRIEDPRALSAGRNRHCSGGMDSINDLDACPQYDKYAMKSSRALIFCNKEAWTISEDIVKSAAEAEVTSVDLSKNQFTDVPDCLKLLTGKISELNLAFNRLSSLPAFLGTCSNLAYLDLRNNQVDDLPSELSCLEMLREINLCCNRFQKIPPVLFELKKLEILLASDNQIQTLDVNGLSQLPVITIIDLRNNSLSYVPPELGNLKQIRPNQYRRNLYRRCKPI